MTLDAISGQDRAVAALRRAIRSRRTAHAYLFAGPPGVGKNTTALLFARALVCTARTTDAADSCDKCPACLQAQHGNHPDIYRIEPEGAGRLIPIKVLRDRDTGEGLLRDLSLKSFSGGHKVVLIDDAHTMNDEAANCLLKTLEEPPPGSVIILITPRPDALPETILSRCQMIRFAPLAPEILQPLLEQRGIAPDEARFLSRTSGGSLGRAVEMSGESELPELRRRLLQLLIGLRESNLFESTARFKELLHGLGDSQAELRTMTEWLLDLGLLFYRDVAVRQLGLDLTRLANADLQDWIDAEAPITPRAIRAILGTIEQTKSLVRRNVDIDAAVLDAFSKIAAYRSQRAA